LGVSDSAGDPFEVVLNDQCSVLAEQDPSVHLLVGGVCDLVRASALDGVEPQVFSQIEQETTFIAA
jgi:hypothetical protein